jgi:hypothetical protein
MLVMTRAVLIMISWAGVALDNEEDDGVSGSKRLWICKLANDVTYKRRVFASSNTAL